jgi:hypothetical protein
MQINTSFVYGGHVCDIYYCLEDYGGEIRSYELKIGLISFTFHKMFVVSKQMTYIVVKLSYYLGFS